MGKTARNQKHVYDALSSFNTIIKTSNNNNYIKDSKFKTEVLKTLLAERSMMIALFYLKEKSYLAGLIRYQEVVKYFPDTIYIEEALYRITYIYAILGMEEEAFKSASVLGHNYPNGKWYKLSLDIINNHTSIEKGTIIPFNGN